MFKLIFVFLIINIFNFITVKSDCSVPFGVNAPLIFRNFGSKKILHKSLDASFVLRSEETVEIICSTGFINEPINNRYNHIQCGYTEELTLKCSGSNLYYTCKNNYQEYNVNYEVFECKRNSNRYLYESSHSLRGCNSSMSLGIGIALENMEDVVTASLCYDWDALSLKFISYNTNYHNQQFLNALKQTHKNRNKNRPITDVNLNKMLENYNTIFPFLSNEYFYMMLNELKNKNDLLNAFDFNYQNIIQNKKLKDDLSGFENILNIIWWRNLLEGNWKLFEKVLNEKTNNRNYVITMGTSDKLTYPTISCNNSEELKIENKNIVTYAPKYIWSHIRSIENSTENFVVIGVNSPFDQMEKTIENFCKDICDEIEWLQKSIFSKTRKLLTMGLVFCCKADDVVYTLENFPYQPNNSTNNTSTEGSIQNLDLSYQTN